MKKKIIAICFVLLLVCCLVPHTTTKAAAPSGILNNGMDGISININAAPYTTFANVPTWGQYAYTNQGCAWFASARAKQITGIGSTIWSGYSFWYNQYNLFGYGRGTTPRAKSLACYENHVSVVEKVSGNQLTISEGGSGNSNASHGYCIITRKTAPTVGTSYGVSGKFLGYVYLNGGSSTSTTVSMNWIWDDCQPTTNDVWVYTKAVANISGHFSRAGIDFWDSVGTHVGGKSESTNYTRSELEVWYTVSKEMPNMKLKPGTKYSYRFYVVFNGKQYYGPTKTFQTKETTSNRLATPAVTSVKNGNGAVVVKWSAVNGATGYRLFRSTDGGNTWTGIVTLGGTSYSDKNVKANVKYTYTVRAYRDTYAMANANIYSANYWSDYKHSNPSVTYKSSKPFSKVTLSKKSYVYTGKAFKPTVKVYVGKTKLSSKYYSVSYKNNKNAGTATVTVTGKSKYSNYKSVVKFTIKPKSFTKVTLSSSKYSYNGKAKKPTAKVYVGKTKLSSKYYTLSYKNNKKVGTATVTIKGKGKYSNYQSKKTFKIVPKKQVIVSAKSSQKGRVDVVHTYDAMSSGYQVQVSAYKSFKSIFTQGIFKGNQNYGWYAYGMKSGKTYYLRVRSYKTINGKRWYGAWSNVKPIKIK